jgi:DNA-binding NtrC family response regulator
VRELKHAVERAVLLEEGDWLTEADFEPDASHVHEIQKASAGPSSSDPTGARDTLVLCVPLEQASAHDVERMLAQKVLEHVGGNKMKAARILKVSRPRLVSCGTRRREGNHELRLFVLP